MQYTLLILLYLVAIAENANAQFRLGRRPSSHSSHRKITRDKDQAAQNVTSTAVAHPLRPGIGPAPYIPVPVPLRTHTSNGIDASGSSKPAQSAATFGNNQLASQPPFQPAVETITTEEMQRWQGGVEYPMFHNQYVTAFTSTVTLDNQGPGHCACGLSHQNHDGAFSVELLSTGAGAQQVLVSRSVPGQEHKVALPTRLQPPGAAVSLFLGFTLPAADSALLDAQLGYGAAPDRVVPAPHGAKASRKRGILRITQTPDLLTACKCTYTRPFIQTNVYTRAYPMVMGKYKLNWGAMCRRPPNTTAPHIQASASSTGYTMLSNSSVQTPRDLMLSTI
ncbi:hypothetical protein RI367_003929 [Sorochytrium milnesiophthora]